MCVFHFSNAKTRTNLDLLDTWSQVITLCERLAGQDANVTTVPVSVLRLTRQLTRLFEWTNDVADRLAFSEVLPFTLNLSGDANLWC